MRRLVLASVLGSILLCGAAFAADAPAYIGRHTSTPQDTQAINKVIDDFKVAIKTKNTKWMSTLVLNLNILFDSPGSAKDIACARRRLLRVRQLHRLGQGRGRREIPQRQD